MFKEQEDILQFAQQVDTVDVGGLITSLMDWKAEVEASRSFDDDIRISMIDTFIDMVVDSCVM